MKGQCDFVAGWAGSLLKSHCSCMSTNKFQNYSSHFTSGLSCSFFLCQNIHALTCVSRSVCGSSGVHVCCINLTYTQGNKMAHPEFLSSFLPYLWLSSIKFNHFFFMFLYHSHKQSRDYFKLLLLSPVATAYSQALRCQTLMQHLLS